MKIFKKLLAVTLIFALLGQNALFAQAIPVETLSSMQQQANADLQETGLSEKGKILLSIGGTAFATSLVWVAIHRHLTNVEKKKNALNLKYLIKGHENEILNIQRQAANTATETTQRLHAEFTARLYEKERQLERYRGSEVATVQRELDRANIKKEGYKKSAEVQKAKKEAAVSKQRYLEDLLDAQQKNIDLYQEALDHFTQIDLTAVREMEKYQKLFDISTPQADRQALRASLELEPWFKAATQEQQKTFLATIDNAIFLTHQGKTTRGASHVLFMHATSFLPKAEKDLYQRLLTLSRQLFTKNNLFAISLLAVFGVSAHAMQAQAADYTMADRINTNFDLFLHASEEELQEIANNEEAVKVCVEGAYALHMMKALPKSEIDAMMQTLQAPAAENNRNAYNTIRSSATY